MCGIHKVKGATSNGVKFITYWCCQANSDEWNLVRSTTRSRWFIRWRTYCGLMVNNEFYDCYKSFTMVTAGEGEQGLLLLLCWFDPDAPLSDRTVFFSFSPLCVSTSAESWPVAAVSEKFGCNTTPKSAIILGVDLYGKQHGRELLSWLSFFQHIFDYWWYKISGQMELFGKWMRSAITFTDDQILVLLLGAILKVGQTVCE